MGEFVGKNVDVSKDGEGTQVVNTSRVVIVLVGE
jgi:hypothetical protein